MLPPCIRQHTSAYVSIRIRQQNGLDDIQRLCCHAPTLWPASLHASAYVSMRQGLGFRVRLRHHTSAYVSIRQHTSAYVSIRQHTSAYVSIRQHTSAYVSVSTVSKEALLPRTDTLAFSGFASPELWQKSCSSNASVDCACRYRNSLMVQKYSVCVLYWCNRKRLLV
jgi:hypothetical protein